MSLSIKGIVPVIPISFDASEEIDLNDLRRAVDFAITCNPAAICLPAYGSEFYKLSDAERERVVTVAIEQANGRIPVIAQANHPSSKLASEIARRYETLGADLISVALPRQFPLAEQDLLRYCGRVAEAVSCPVLLQDFNPGGPTIGAEFLYQAIKQHDNIRYAKLEEPLVGSKIAAIRERVGDSLGLLTGWGGLFLLDGLSAGSCGAMPGLAIADVFAKIFSEYQSGKTAEASEQFAQLLPYVNFSLQSFEYFLAMEKRLLLRRGVIHSARCRDATRTMDAMFSGRADEISNQLIRRFNLTKETHVTK